MQGLDRREPVQKTGNAALAGTPAVTQVPMTGIGGVRPQYVSGVGDSLQGLAKVAQKASSLIADLTEKQVKEDTLDGQIWFSQGKTEEQLKQEGNYYNAIGYNNAAAVTAGLEWYSAETAGLEDRKAMDPTSYRNYLVDTYKQINRALPNADKTTQALVYQQMQEQVNKLASAHAVKHQAYNRDMTKQNTHQLLLAQDQAVNASPVPDMERANLKQYLSSNPTGLNDEDYKEVLTEVFSTAAAQGGSTNALEVFTEGTSAIPQKKLIQMSKDAGLAPMLFSSVVAAESSGMSYDKSGNIIKNPDSSAQGPMQVLADTGKDPGYGVAPAKDKSVAELYRLGRDYLAAMHKEFGDQSLAVMAFHAGPGRMNEVIEKVGTDPEAVYRYFKDGAAGTDPKRSKATAEYFDKITRFNNGDPTELAKMIDKGAAYTALVEKGFDSAQITKVMNSLDGLYKKTAETFSDTRFKATEALQEKFLSTGNSDALMQDLQIMADQGQLSVNDAEHIAGTLKPQWEKQREQAMQDADSVSLAVSAHTVGELSPRLKDLAVKQQYAKISGEEQAKLQEQYPGAEVPKDKLQEAIMSRQISFLQNNGIVDTDMKARINSGFNMPLMKDNTVSQEAKNSFTAYAALANTAGQDFADKFLDPQNKKLAQYAYRNTSTGVAPEVALLAAKSMLETEKATGVDLKSIGLPGTADERAELVSTLTEEFIQNWNPKMFPASMFNAPTMTGYAQVHDEQVEQVQQSPLVQRMIQETAELEFAKGGNIDSARVAVNKLTNRLTVVLGNPVFSPEGSGNSIQDKAGFTTRGFGDVDLAVQMYLQSAGPATYKEQWKAYQKANPSEKSVLGLWGGIPWGAGTEQHTVPPGRIQYDPRSAIITYTPYTDSAKQTLAPKSVYIPVKTLGDKFNQEVNKHKTTSVTSFSGIADSAGSVIQRLRGGSGIGDY